jgi:stearoyl-CoA desaturase (delta-9 desaturase)
MVTKEWVAIHRKHHAKCETEDDPHSPQTRGIDTVLLARRRAVPRESEEPGNHGQVRPWHARRLDRAQPLHPLQLAGRGPDADHQRGAVRRGRRAVWAVQMLWIPDHAAGIINGIGHYWGYRNFEAPDASTNISPWGIVIGGEELHNNHHTYPTSAKFSVKPYEFDIGWVYISLMQKIGWAKVKKVPPKLRLGAIKPVATRRRWRP